MISAGKTKILIDTADLTSGDSIAAYLVSASGSLITSTSIGGNEHLRVVAVGSFQEDSTHVSGDYGVQMLAVRNDANSAFTSTDGDYSAIAVDSAGRLKTVASSAYAEDSAASSGDMGQFILTVRRDTSGTTASNDGDYAEIQTNSRGEVRVANKAETTVLQQVITVGTTATALPAIPLTGRKSLMVQMLSSGQLYLGSATVTNTGETRGFQLSNGGYAAFDIGALSLYGVASAANKSVVVLEFA